MVFVLCRVRTLVRVAGLRLVLCWPILCFRTLLVGSSIIVVTGTLRLGRWVRLNVMLTVRLGPMMR